MEGLRDLTHTSIDHFTKIAEQSVISRRGIAVQAVNVVDRSPLLVAPLGDDLFGGRWPAAAEAEVAHRKRKAEQDQLRARAARGKKQARGRGGMSSDSYQRRPAARQQPPLQSLLQPQVMMQHPQPQVWGLQQPFPATAVSAPQRQLWDPSSSLSGPSAGSNPRPARQRARKGRGARARRAGRRGGRWGRDGFGNVAQPYCRVAGCPSRGSTSAVCLGVGDGDLGPVGPVSSQIRLPTRVLHPSSSLRGNQDYRHPARASQENGTSRRSVGSYRERCGGPRFRPRSGRSLFHVFPDSQEVGGMATHYQTETAEFLHQTPSVPYGNPGRCLASPLARVLGSYTQPQRCLLARPYSPRVSAVAKVCPARSILRVQSPSFRPVFISSRIHVRHQDW